MIAPGKLVFLQTDPGIHKQNTLSSGYSFQRRCQNNMRQCWEILLLEVLSNLFKGLQRKYQGENTVVTRKTNYLRLSNCEIENL